MSGTVYCHKAMRISHSELGFRRGRRAPLTAFGRSKVYRPRKLMCLKAAGETLAISACETPGYCGGPIEDQKSVVYIPQKSHAK
jgi:hypothetical protein